MLRSLPIPVLVVVLLVVILWSAFTSPLQAQQSLSAEMTATATVEVAEEVEPTPTITATPLPAELTVELLADYPLTAFPSQAGFSLHFNQPVDVSGDFLPVQINPYPDSSLSWNRSHTQLRVLPISPLQPGATYT